MKDNRRRKSPAALLPHPLADQFPKMNDLEFDALVADIKANGLKEPIVLFEGRILDGRHRYEACQRLGIMPQTVEFPGDAAEARAYSTAANLMRRHLKQSQKAMLIAKHGLASTLGMSAERRDKPGIRDAAARYGVNHVTLYKAFYVLQHGAPEDVEEVLAGRKSVGQVEADVRRTDAGGAPAKRGRKLTSLAKELTDLAQRCGDREATKKAQALMKQAITLLKTARAVR